MPDDGTARRAAPRRERPGARSWLRAIGPGILVAATGVGAGDLATGAFTGSALGAAVLWAVLVGAGLKFVLNEGLARWQLATGETLLEGVMRRVPRPARFLFLLYLLPWSWFVGTALVSACGVTAHALFPVAATPEAGKIGWGIAHSLLGLVLVLRGGFRLFERLMGACIALMFVTVVVTAVRLRPDWGDVLEGLFVPRVPKLGEGGLAWTIGLMGGVGGTLTVLCYGYWIREEGRADTSSLGACRLDLGLGYAMTALFGLAMVIIGSTIAVEGKGAGLIVALGERLGEQLGPAARLVFLVGAWGAVFSSLVGVWQAVPYLFADFWRLAGREPERAVGRPIDVRTPSYQLYLFALAFVPLFGLRYGFRAIQLAYAVIGAAFLPLLALTLLILNGRRAWVGEHRNRPWTVAVLVVTLVFFAWAGWIGLTS